jgi:hypothetical protein
MRLPTHVARGLAAMSALAPLMTLDAHASVAQRTFRAAHVERGVATFPLRRLDADTIVGGTVAWRGGSRRLARERVRAAARRGVLRVRTPRVRKPKLIVTTAPAPRNYSVRGMYGRDGSRSGFDTLVSLGFNAIDSNPYAASINPLAAAGAKGFVWLGGYSNTSCTFNSRDAWVRSHVSPLAGNPGVAGYFVDDEPDAAACPSAPAQMKARSALVKSIDPGPPTFLVDYKVEQFKLWAPTVDVLGLDHYPCSLAHGCDYAKIDAQAAEADRLGVRYWGVIQAHGDAWYRAPTPEELHQQFLHWRATNMEGYLIFAWSWPAWDPSLWLANNPALQRQLAIENAG